MSTEVDLSSNGVVKSTLLRMVEPSTGDTEKILTLSFATLEGHINITRIYAPTLEAISKVKEKLYEQRDHVVNRIPVKQYSWFNTRMVED